LRMESRRCVGSGRRFGIKPRDRVFLLMGGFEALIGYFAMGWVVSMLINVLLFSTMQMSAFVMPMSVLLVRQGFVMLI
jgi:hypothetical protein